MIDLIPVAAAQTAFTVTDLQGLDLGKAVYLLVSLAILGAGALSIIFVFYGGFTFILSGGDEGKVKEAINMIRYAIIGLVVTLLSLVIVPFVGRLFNVNFNFLDFARLSQEINTLFYRLRDSSAPTTSGGLGAPTQPQTSAANQNVMPNVPVTDLIR